MGSYCPSIFTNDRWLSHYLKPGASKSEAHSVQHVLWGTQGGRHVEVIDGNPRGSPAIRGGMSVTKISGIYHRKTIGKWMIHQNIWENGGFFMGTPEENHRKMEVLMGLTLWLCLTVCY